MKTYRASIAGDSTDLLICYSDHLSVCDLEPMINDALASLRAEILDTNCVYCGEDKNFCQSESAG